MIERMSIFERKIAKANRLNAVAERIGFALLQLQELESVAAQHYVLIAKASPGMGIEAGLELVDEALSKTFGKTVTCLQKSGQVPDDTMARLQALLEERNWLVHNSKADSNLAVRDEAACTQLIKRIDAIADEALALIKVVTEQAKIFFLSKGFRLEDIKLAEQRTRQKA